MSTETITPPPAAEQSAESDQPKLGVASQGEPTGDKADAESADAGDGDSGDPHERTIKKLQRRIERLSGKVGAAARERDMLREQLASTQQATGTQQDAADGDIEARARAKAQELVTQDRLNARAADTLKAGKKIDGFTEALETLRDEIPFMDEKKRITPFFEAILDVDNPAKVIHYLGSNPEEAAEFEGLTPAQIGRRLARLEIKLTEGTKEKPSSAPVPLKPVRGSAPDTGGLDEPNISDAEWIRRREKALRAQRS
jgi:hypothetical protein